MSFWSSNQVARVIRYARSLDHFAKRKRIGPFIAEALGLTVGQQASMLTQNGLAFMEAELTRKRQEMLEIDGEIPNYIVHRDATGRVFVSGWLAYLKLRGISDSILRRLKHHGSVREHLKKMATGHDLEAVVSGVLDEAMESGFATRGSGDQGIDAIGISEVMPIDSSFLESIVEDNDVNSIQVFTLASSKQYRFAKDKAELVSPAFIRELIGGWTIQRSEIAAWKSHGLKLLSPIQVVLATTYRLSSSSRLLCRKLGVQVMALPQLVYFICAYAPDSVFANKNSGFSKVGFRKWWESYDEQRVTA